MWIAWTACALLLRLSGAAAAALYVQNNCDSAATVAVTFSTFNTGLCYWYVQIDPTVEAVCINAWYDAPGGGTTTLLVDGIDNGCVYLTAHKADNEAYVWPVLPTCQAPGLCQHDLTFLPCVGDPSTGCYYWFNAPGDGSCVPNGEDYTWKITCETGVVPVSSPSPDIYKGTSPSSPGLSPSPPPAGGSTQGSTANDSRGEGSSLSIGAIVGIAVGGVVALAAVLALIFYCRRRKRRLKAPNLEAPVSQSPAGAMAAGPLAHCAIDPPTKPPLHPFDSAYTGSALPPSPYDSIATQSSLTASQAPSAPVATVFARGVPAAPSTSIESDQSLPSQPSSGADPLHLMGSGAGSWQSGTLPSRGPLASWELRWEELKLERSIGAGSYGHVYKGTYHETPVAVKVLLEPGGEGSAGSVATDATAAAVTSAAAHSQLMSPSSPLMARLEQEAAIMSLMSHPAIIQFLGLTTAPVAAIVTEFASRGSLHTVLLAATNEPAKAAALTWERRIGIAADCCRGMLYLHSRTPPIVHRDLKSPNVLIGTHWNAKISDFNLSKLVDDATASQSGSATMTALNPRWLAPEVLQGERVTKAADVYAFGVILWELMTWQLPWTGVNPWSIVSGVAAGRRPPLPPRDRLPGPPGSGKWAGFDAYVKLMERCWAQKPEDRPTFEAVMAELRAIDPAAAAADE